MTKVISRKKPGLYFCLESIFTELNHQFFDKNIEANIRWGQSCKTRKPKKSIRLGSYCHKTKLITIHPSLDQAVVPHFCLERIIFHEMAHQKFPPKKSTQGKILAHYREFNDFEKTYPFLREADAWLKAYLPRLLSFF